MKILVMYDYPPPPGGLATQGDMLYRGLVELGADVCPVSFESPQEKEWYFRWFKPDVAVGVGYWGYVPHLVLHPRKFGVTAVPWLVADGYIANYMDVLNSLPLVLVTSNWVKEVYVRDGMNGSKVEVLPVGSDMDAFHPFDPADPRILAVREGLNVPPDKLMILTVGGDAASKGSQEVMQALGRIDKKVPDWRYVCKVWPQPRTQIQNNLDMQLAKQLGIHDKVIYAAGVVSRNFMPHLIASCDIYAAPSRLEGFGMPMVEAGACEKPVLSMRAMGMLDTLVHGKTALLVGIGKEIRISETILGEESGFEPGHRVVFSPPRVSDYRASVDDIAEHLLTLMTQPELRKKMGQAARKRVVELFDYRVVAKRLIQILTDRLGLR